MNLSEIPREQFGVFIFFELNGDDFILADADLQLRDNLLGRHLSVEEARRVFLLALDFFVRLSCVDIS